VALKQIGASGASATIKERFRARGACGGAPAPSSIAAVYDATQDHIAMQLVRGGSLAELVAAGTRPPARDSRAWCA
jgi:hypothetical protein